MWSYCKIESTGFARTRRQSPALVSQRSLLNSLQASYSDLRGLCVVSAVQCRQISFTQPNGCRPDLEGLCLKLAARTNNSPSRRANGTKIYPAWFAVTER